MPSVDHFVIGVDNDYIAAPGSSDSEVFKGLDEIKTEEQATDLALRMIRLGEIEFKVDIEARDADGNLLWIRTIWEREDDGIKPKESD